MLLRSYCRSSPHDNVCHCSLWPLTIIFSTVLITTQIVYHKFYIEPNFAAYQEAYQLSLKFRKFLRDVNEYQEDLDAGALSSFISQDEAKDLIKKQIDLYDADKTFKADYALESSGATIVTTRCTKGYADKNIKYSINGMIPILFTSNSPRVVIQPSIQPGDCWSFAGREGKMVVQLSRTIIPTSFTYEHIRKELSPDLNIDSAPKAFKVKTLRDVNDYEGTLLGEYHYDRDGQPMQQFKVQHPNPMPTRYIELSVFSNHGEPLYTCLYRFRVHGLRY